jgi:hypothetical protein
MLNKRLSRFFDKPAHVSPDWTGQQWRVDWGIRSGLGRGRQMSPRTQVRGLRTFVRPGDVEHEAAFTRIVLRINARDPEQQLVLPHTFDMAREVLLACYKLRRDLRSIGA